MDDILNIGFVFFDSGWCLIGRDRFVVYFLCWGENLDVMNYLYIF